MFTALSGYQQQVRDEVDPNYDVLNDPDIGYMAKSIMASGDPYGEGHFTVAEPMAEGGTAFGRTMRQGAFSAAEGIGEVTGQVANAINWLGIGLLEGLDSDMAAAYREQTSSAVYVNKQGRIVQGKGKVNGMAGPFQGYQLLRGATVTDLEKTMESLHSAREWDHANVNQEGFEFYANAMALGAGGIASFLGTGGVQMIRGSVKGAAWLLGAKGAKLGALNRAMIGLAGVTAGTTTHSMFVNGRVEGYGKAAIEGAKLGPIFWALGIMGSKAEHFLASRGKMPAFVKRGMMGLVGMAEGAGLTGGEFILDKAWNFMRDPTPGHARDWAQTLTANMFGFGVMKATMGRTLPEETSLREVLGEENYQALLAREQEVGRIREEVQKVETEEGLSQLASQEGVSRETIREYGQALREQVAAKGDESAAIEAKMRDIEDRIGLEKAGRDMTEEQRQTLDMEMRDRIAELTEELPGAEAQAEIADLELIRESIRPEISEVRRAEDIIAETRAQPVTEAEARARLAETGRELQKRGKLEAGLEEGGRIVPEQVSEFLGRGEDVVTRIQQLTQRREGGGRRKTEVGLAVAEGRVETLKGDESAIDLFRLMQKKGMKPHKTSSLHSHPGAEPASIADLANMAFLKLGQKGARPDYITTAESVYEIRAGEREKAPTFGELAEMRTTAEARRDRLTRGAAQRIAKQHGVELSRVKEVFEKWSRGEKLTRQERSMSRELLKAREEAMVAAAKDMGLVLRKVSAKEASSTLSEVHGVKKPPGPPKPPRPPKPPGQVAEMRAPPAPRQGKPKSLDISPSLELEGEEGTPFMRQSDIEQRMRGFEGDPIRVPIRPGVGIKGKFSTAGLLGWFNRVENQIRLKDAEDILPMTHEFAHAFEQMAEERGVWDPKVPAWMRAELKEVASTYPNLEKLSARDQVAEGYAEFWARWMLDDPRLPTEVPELWEWMNTWISRPEMKDFRRQLGEVQLLHRQWRNLGAKGRIGAGIKRGGDPRTPVEREARGGLWERLMRSTTRHLFDDIIDIKQAQSEYWKDAGLSERDVPITINPVRMIEAMRMRAYHEAQQMMNEGTHDLQGRRTGESVKEILKEIEKLGPEQVKDFITYIVARRAANLNARGIRSGFSTEDALYTIKALERPEFQRAAERIREYANRVLEYGVEAGSISEEAVQRMVEAEPIWIPFQRVLSLPGEPSVVRTGPTRGVAERAGGPKRIKGHGRAIRDPIQALGEATAAVVSKAQQHMVMKAMFLQSKLFPKLGGLVTEVPRDVEPRQILVERLTQELERIGKKRGREAEAARITEDITELMGGESEALTFFFQKAFPDGPRPVLAFRPNFSEGELERLGIERDTNLFESLMSQSGKLVWLEVDPRAYNTLMTIDGPKIIGQDAGLLVRGLLLPTKMLRFGATVLNPDFIIRNLIRDPFARQMFTQTRGMDAGIISGFGSLLAGMVERLQGTEGAKMFKALGLEGATLFGTEMAREMQMRESTAGSVFVGLAGAARKVGELFSQPETWLRVDEFNNVRAQKIAEGASELDATLEAALAAKEVTTNFTRRGATASVINQFIPYFAPGLAGARKFWRTVLGREGAGQQRRAITQGVFNIGGAAALFYLLHRDEEWYQELPMWRRVNYFNTKIGDTIVSFPKPFEAGIFFGSTMEMMLQGIEGEFDKTLAKEVAWEFAKQHFVGMPWIPSPVLPIAEQWSNYSFFLKRQIVPDWQLRSRLPEDQYTAYTGEVYKWIGENLGVSPSRIEYGFNALFGGLPRQLTRAVETVTGVRDQGSFADTPGLGVLFRQTEGKQARSVDELHDLNLLLQQKAGSQKLTQQETLARPLISDALQDLSQIRTLQRTGTISRDESNRRQMRRAREALTRFRRLTER